MKKMMPLSSKQLLKFTLESLDNDKGMDIVSIDLIGRSSIADYMVVVSGNTVRQVTAMANNLIKKYKEMGLRLPSPEGCLLYTSPSPRDATLSRMPSSA